MPKGVYTLTLGSELVIDKSLTLSGAGSGDTIVQAAANSGDANHRVFKITSGDVAISSVGIRHGKIEGNGGGIWTAGTTLTVTNSNISGNVASGDGGGIYNAGTLTLTNVTITDNQASDSGGGIRNRSDATLTMTGSTVSNNTADGFAGGIYNKDAMTLNNSTISGNTATSDGGGIRNEPGELTLNNSTVTNNTTGGNGGGGIDNPGGTVRMANSIVGGNNPSGRDCSGNITSLGHNLDSDGTCGLNSTGDLVNVTDPKLGPMADNGGPTLTHALLPGSPAINHIPAQDCVVTRDQRGAFRPQGAGCDIGAYEYMVPGDADADGVVGLVDVRIVGGALGGSGRGDLNLDGVINVFDLVLAAINLGRPGE